MKYETPEVTVLMPAITAAQMASQGAKIGGYGESIHPVSNDVSSAYADWE